MTTKKNKTLKKLESVEAFKKFVSEFQQSSSYREPIGFGIARVDRGQVNSEKILQATYPVVNWKENFGSAAVFLASLEASGVGIDVSGSEFVSSINAKFIENALNLFEPFMNEADGDKHRNIQVIAMLEEVLGMEGFDVEVDYKIIFIFEDVAPKSVESAYLKLYALSLGKAPLRSLNLNGIFGLLTNCAWAQGTPIELDYLREHEIELKLTNSYPPIDFVDKFPRFLTHVIPADNTRVLDSSKVRFGAQLAAGTTVMPGASYINFNAGTTGAVMVEGRISSSAIVEAGSDVGGGASILGVLSGTNGNPITIGKNTLLGANSVTGIPLGDGCIVDAGISILEGTKVFISRDEVAKIKDVNPSFNPDESKELFKGLEIAGLNGIHFRQNSQNGQITGSRSKREVKLNVELH
ncbi:MAG: tetrahydrodipicolinate N-succinyltransferase N-terminal domain-containing protein [Campylobacterales bacterium]|nr:tetrahydrodipicolinate N-succinyltransferase N-terminal domain-containing protein [Campylobacterales bacterium]